MQLGVTWRRLAFGLAVRPRRRDCGADRGLILGDAVGEGGYEARASPFEPWIKVSVGFLADHSVKGGDDLSGLHQQRHAILNRRDGDGLRF